MQNTTQKTKDPSTRTPPPKKNKTKTKKQSKQHELWCPRRASSSLETIEFIHLYFDKLPLSRQEMIDSKVSMGWYQFSKLVFIGFLTS